MNQEVELLGLLLKLMGGKVGSTGYPPEKYKSKKGKRDRLLPWTYSEEVGWETSTFHFMLCHSNRIVLGSSLCVYLNKCIIMFTWNSPMLGHVPEPLVEEPAYYNTEEGSPDVFIFNFSSLPG